MGVAALVQVVLSDEQLDDLAERIVERLREPAPDQWMSTEEAAEYLGIHVVTLRKLAAERRIAATQESPGCKLYFKRSALDASREGRSGAPGG